MSKELDRLSLRLTEALAERRRASRGSDKDWHRDCKQDVINVRDQIRRQLIKEDQK